MSGATAVGPAFDRLAARVAEACRRSGRNPTEVQIVGASKRQPMDRLRAAYDAGLRSFGENRVQEAAANKPQLPSDVAWHLIGPLQSNKARRAVELFDVVESVDRLKIARALDREAQRAGRRLGCLLAVNLGGEPTKHGFAVADVLAAAQEMCASLHNLELLGLMAIPPPSDQPEGARRWFRELRELRDQVRGEIGSADFPGYLSMGMSGDFEIAVEEGATHVRVGTALFGARDT